MKQKVAIHFFLSFFWTFISNRRWQNLVYHILYWLYLGQFGNICMICCSNIEVFTHWTNNAKKYFSMLLLTFSIFLQYCRFLESISNVNPIFNKYYYFFGNIYDKYNYDKILDPNITCITNQRIYYYCYFCLYLSIIIKI